MPTGLNTSVGFAPETKYGEYAAPSDFIEVESFGIARKSDYLASRPLRGRPGIPAARHRETTRQAEGAVALEVPNKGLGPLLNLLHGETVTPAKQAETIAYKQVHKIGVTAPQGKSLTIQANKPTVEQDEPFTYTGAKITNATFSCDTSAQLKASFDVMARDALTSEELATPSYPDPIKSRDFTEAVVEIDGEAVTQLDLIIHSFNLTVPLPMKTGRYGLGQGALQLEPIGFNETMLPTIELACEFSNRDMYDHYTNQDEVPVVIKFVGPVIASTYHEEIAFSVAVAKFVGSDPEVSGPDVLDQTASLEVYDSITEPLVTIDYLSVDTTL